MEDQVTRLVDKAWNGFQQTPEDRRFMIAIGGIPGSGNPSHVNTIKSVVLAKHIEIPGKTTLSQIVTRALNARHATLHPEILEAVPIAAYVPMDGYHLTRAQLSAMPDPDNAHARRGAEFTFDGVAFLRLVQALRVPLAPTEEGVIYAPSFDHAVKDPNENDIAILPAHRIVVFEGLYVCLDKAPWREAAMLMDERWFVHVNLKVARRRLVVRHVRAGIADDEEAAGKRADENDLVNGEQIMRDRVDVHEVVVSREDDNWKHE